MTRLLPLLIAVSGSLASAQTVEENAGAIATNAYNIAVNADAIAANVNAIAAETGNRMAGDAANAALIEIEIGETEAIIYEAAAFLAGDISVNAANIHNNASNIHDNAVSIATIADAIATVEPPYTSLPFRIPPAFIVDGGWIEVRWICADTAPADCDLGMRGDGGHPIVLRSFVLPTFVGGRQSDNTVNSSVLSISAVDPESYWLGAPLDGDPPPKHLWLVHERGWLHTF